MNFLTSIETSAIANWIRESPSIWAYPVVIFFHAVGLSILVGLSGVIDLAVLGFAPGLEIASMKKLYPIIGVGFWINVASGIVLSMVDASTMLINPLFWTKMVLIGFATVNVLWIKKQIFRAPLPEKNVFSPQLRALAVISLVLWMAAITTGRLTAYLGPANTGPIITAAGK